MGLGALHRVAGPAQQLQVVGMVRASLRSRDDVVNGEVAVMEVDTASGAVPLLLAVEGVLMGGVVGEWPHVRALGNVGAGGDVAVMKEAAHCLLEPHVHKLHRLLGQVYAHPLAVEPCRRLRRR